MQNLQFQVDKYAEKEHLQYKKVNRNRLRNNTGARISKDIKSYYKSIPNVEESRGNHEHA